MTEWKTDKATMAHGAQRNKGGVQGKRTLYATAAVPHCVLRRYMLDVDIACFSYHNMTCPAARSATKLAYSQIILLLLCLTLCPAQVHA
jgi:hypothetical protein